MSTFEGFGNPIGLKGKLASDRASHVPLFILNNLRQHTIPVTIGGANRVTFTLKGATRPVSIWHENDLFHLDEDLAYTWGAVSNNILNSSGVNATDTDSVLGVWYMYTAITQDSDGAWQYEIRPSQTAPLATAGPNNSGYLGHPGTSKSYPWRYVGFMVCTTAATPVFRAMIKVGSTYHFAAQSVATTATWAALDFSASIPSIDGIKVAGKLQTAAIGTVAVSGSSVEDQGVLVVSAVGLTDNIIAAPFGPIVSNGLGKVWAKDTVDRGSVAISQVVDVV